MYSCSHSPEHIAMFNFLSLNRNFEVGSPQTVQGLVLATVLPAISFLFHNPSMRVRSNNETEKCFSERD